MAGIMGGEASGVSDKTTKLFLESAFFTPELMAGRARSYGLHTDASHRYERGVDFQLQRQAMERATQLFLDRWWRAWSDYRSCGGGRSAGQRASAAPRVTNRKTLGCCYRSCHGRAHSRRARIWVVTHEHGWLCTAPSWRFDMGLEVDLIEELARIIGYDAVPSQRITADLIPTPVPETRRLLRNAKNELVARLL